jgi:hypothetical protein
MGLTDMGTGTATDTKKGICTRTRDTRIRVPGGFPVPVSITNHQQPFVRTIMSSILQYHQKSSARVINHLHVSLLAVFFSNISNHLYISLFFS